MQAIILSIGDELVLGQTVDTNSAWLAGRLAEFGISCLYHQTIADDRPAIGEAIRLAAERAELVIISGGLGPTEDDLTRAALADAMGQPLEVDEESVAEIEAYFRARNRQMPERNRVQAMRPRMTTAITNTCGTAPGIRAELAKATIYVTPGVPSEMFEMFEKSIAPELREVAGGRVILTSKINTFGAGESTVADMLGELMDRARNPKVGTTVSDGLVCARVRSEFSTVEESRAKLDETVAMVEAKLCPIAFGRHHETLQIAVMKLLKTQGRRLVTAESCTGGLLGELLTEIPGASQGYVGGWITYANNSKSRQLGVPDEMLEKYGAVSEEVACAMARGALEQEPAADLSLAITGVAGPGGGTPEKPVGTVWLAIGERSEDDGECATVPLLLQLVGDRPLIRDRAAKCALQMLRLHLLGEKLSHISWARQVRSGQMTTD